MRRGVTSYMIGLLWALALVLLLTAGTDLSCFEAGPAAPTITLLAERGTLYLNTDDGSSAVQANTGKLLWHEAPIAFTQAADTGTAYVFTKTDLEARRVRDQAVLWQRPLSANQSFASPIRAADGVLYLEYVGSLLALRASDGALLWQQNIHSRLDTLAGFSRLEVRQGVVYLAGTSLEALRASDGTLLWQTALGTGEARSMVLDEDRLYVSTTTLLESVQASTGNVLRHKNITWQDQLLAATGGKVYLVTNTTPQSIDTTLQAFQGGDGALLWQLPNNALPFTAVVATGDTVSFTMGHALHAVRASSGASVWQHSIGHLEGRYNVNLALASSAEAVYVGAAVVTIHDGNCRGASSYAIEGVRPADGSLLWSFQA